jgi:hypothetical protein
MKDTIIQGTIFTDGDDIAKLRNDLTQDAWEWGVNNALKNLFQVVHFRSSQPVLRELSGSKKKF